MLRGRSYNPHISLFHTSVHTPAQLPLAHPSWARTSAEQARLLSIQAAASRQPALQPSDGSSMSQTTCSAPSTTIRFWVSSQLQAMLLQRGSGGNEKQGG